MKRIAVIMAGGSGTRFWPLSRRNLPKQLLNLTGEEIMLNRTIGHYAGVIPAEDTYVVTNAAQADLTAEKIDPRVERSHILVEPMARNTAPCILYAAMALYQQYGDAIMVTLPADHYISDVPAYQRVLSHACEVAEETSSLVTIGIQPSYPSTGYGYIRRSAQSMRPGVYMVEQFVEKPPLPVAEEYCRQGNYLWNSGQFVWKLSTILERFRQYLPEMHAAMEGIREELRTPHEAEAIGRIYPQLQSVSVDYGIMEKADDVLVLPGDFGWNDVGSWDALDAVFPSDDEGNIIRSLHVGVDTKGCVLHSATGKLIATVGVEDLVVVETGDTILICPKNRAQEVKKLVDALESRNLKEYL